MPEVYRVLFEVFGLDPEDEECQPKLRRQLEDVDYVSAEFEGKKLSWQEVAAYKASSNKYIILKSFLYHDKLTPPFDRKELFFDILVKWADFTIKWIENCQNRKYIKIYVKSFTIWSWCRICN